MPLLALNRKDTGAESIGSKAPKTTEKASSPGKRFHYGGIVAGAGITGSASRLTRFLHTNRHPLRTKTL